MNQYGVARAIFEFLRKVILLDVSLAALVGLIGLALGLRMLESYGTLMIWTGTGLILLATVTGVGGYASRAADSEAFRLTRAGNPAENLRHIAESSQNSFGCVILLVSTGIGLSALGYLLSASAALLNPAFQPVTNARVALVAVALQTERLRTGTMITPVARRRPVQWGCGSFQEKTDARRRPLHLGEGLGVSTSLRSGEPLNCTGDDPSQADEKVRPFAQAGVIRWTEPVDPWLFGGNREELWNSRATEQMRERISQGPPRL